MSAETQWPWSVLGLPGRPEDPKDVRRAYAACLKRIDQSNQIAEFEELRNAYDAARSWVGDAKAARQPSVTAGLRPHNVLPDVAHITKRQTNRPLPASRDWADAEPQANPSPQPQSENEHTPPVSVGETEPAPHSSPSSDPNLDDPSDVLEQALLLMQRRQIDFASWSRLIAAPALADPQVSHELQHLLLNIVVRRRNDLLPVTKEIRAFFHAIDDRFGWVSDGVGFLRRFPQGRQIQSEMAHSLKGRARFGTNSRVQRQLTHANAQGRKIPFGIWVLVVIAWLIVLGNS